MMGTIAPLCVSDPLSPTSVDHKPPSHRRPLQAPSGPSTAVDPNAVYCALFTVGAPSRPPSSFVTARSVRPAPWPRWHSSVRRSGFSPSTLRRQPVVASAARRRVSRSSENTLALSFLLGPRVLFREPPPSFSPNPSRRRSPSWGLSSSPAS
ncbi:hypothetical protein PIB30_026675 [Stylosanthes scabra]|uniref:Uncharacterized protein n=1 Tax=Stylosanthes scabra TaxID=79078 RepID=A0ABU6Z952_9FABA|nr:hypothetical protein [Stylosanthes scabra]